MEPIETYLENQSPMTSKGDGDEPGASTLRPQGVLLGELDDRAVQCNLDVWESANGFVTSSMDLFTIYTTEIN